MRILVIEDKAHHLEDAKLIFASKIAEGIEFDFATTFSEAKSKLQLNVYGGILSDVFLPVETDDQDIRVLKSNLVKTIAEYYGESEEEAEKEMDFEELFQGEMPYGILIGIYALEKELPIVFITDTYHHGKKTEPVNIWTKKKRVPLVDRIVDEKSLAQEGISYTCGDKDEYEKVKQHTFRKKNWLDGFLDLQRIIGGKKGGMVKISSEGIDVIPTNNEEEFEFEIIGS